MKPSDKKETFFYGWIILIGCMLLQGAGTGLFSNCNGVFTQPVPEALGVSRGTFGLYTTIGGLIGMGGMVVYGELYGRNPKSFRKFIILSTAVCCGCVFGYSFATSVWHFYILSAIYGCFFPGLAGISITTLVNNWFIEKRGLATGIAFTGSGISAAIMNPIVRRVVEVYGWRYGYRLLAVTALALMVVAILIIREVPEKKGQLPLGAEKLARDEGGAAVMPELVGLRRREALREPAFYLMVLGFTFLGLAGMGISFHNMAFLTEIGYGGIAGFIASIYLLVMTGAKILLGGLFDRLGSVKSALLTGSCMLASAVALRFAGASPIMPYVFGVCFGFGYSTLTVPYSYLIAESFGTREFAAVYSVCMMLSGLGGSFANPIAGKLYELFGNNYTSVWNIFIVFTLLATACMVTATLIARRKNLNPNALIK
ncbi:MAG: MFS transporter [Clostridiales bacterium]|nr:MFS transporter [Clostridiales bacterium]